VRRRLGHLGRGPPRLGVGLGFGFVFVFVFGFVFGFGFGFGLGLGFKGASRYLTRGRAAHSYA
jgi:hypothetical protein